MTRLWRGLVVAAAGGALTGILSACGVPLQETAEPLPSSFLPAPRVPSTAATTDGSSTPTAATTPSASTRPQSAYLRLWFVQDDGLAAAESTLPVGTAPDHVVRALATGPTPEQEQTGLRTVARDPLTGLSLVSVATPASSPAAEPAPTSSASVFYPPESSVTVRLDPAFSALPPTEQVLLLGQVVLSLAGAGETSVAFTDDAGAPVAVPLPDGRLLDGPATARDYNALIVRP